MNMTVVYAQTARPRPGTSRIGCGGKGAKVEELITRDEIFRTLVHVALPHAVGTDGSLPPTLFRQDVADVVVQRVEHHVQSRLFRALLVFLSAVLLITDDGVQRAVAEIIGVVAHHLVVMDLLEGQRLAVALAVVGALTFGDTRREVIDAGREMAVAPAAVVTGHRLGVLLTEAGAHDIVVGTVVVVVRPFVGPPSVPHPSVLIATEVERVVDESRVALVLCGSLAADGVVRHDGIAVEDDDAGESIRTVHQ